MAEATRCFIVFHGRFPSEKAASLFAAKEAESFALRGIPTTVIAPQRRGIVSNDAAAYFGLARAPVTIAYVQTFDLFHFPLVPRVVAFFCSLFIFSIHAVRYIELHAKQEDIIIFHEAFPLMFLKKSFKRTVYELHDYPERVRAIPRMAFRAVSHILVTNKIKYTRLKKDFPTHAGKAFVEPNGVDTSEFSNVVSQESAREVLQLPQGIPIIVYTGHLYKWKGVDTLAQSLDVLPQDYQVYIVGGTSEDIHAFSEKYHSTRLHLVGHQPHAQIPLWQRAADVLVLPNTGKDPLSTESTSPMKLFEYMASSTPIVASRIPSIQEILPEDSAFFFEADNPHALAASINEALTHRLQAQDRVCRARDRVQQYSWEARAVRILEKIL